MKKGADDMGEFMRNNAIWMTPIISIVLTMLIKIAAKPEFMTLSYLDYLDFGFDLSISALVALLVEVKDETGVWLLLIAFMLIMISAILVNRLGWNRQLHRQNAIGVIASDFIGILLLVMTTSYVGGAIR